MAVFRGNCFPDTVLGESSQDVNGSVVNGHMVIVVVP